MEVGNSPRSWRTITSPQAVRFLADASARRFLAPFLNQERTVSEAASELGVGLNAVLLQVRRLVKLDLLEVTRETERKGRAIKHYRAVANGFFVPYELTTHETPEHWLIADYAEREWRLARDTMRAGARWGETRDKTNFGKRFFRREDGILEADFAFGMTEEADMLEPEAPAIMSAFVVVELEFEAAKELQRELLELIRRYERVGRGSPYLLRLGLAPKSD